MIQPWERTVLNEKKASSKIVSIASFIVHIYPKHEDLEMLTLVLLCEDRKAWKMFIIQIIPYCNVRRYRSIDDQLVS